MKKTGEGVSVSRKRQFEESDSNVNAEDESQPQKSRKHDKQESAGPKNNNTEEGESNDTDKYNGLLTEKDDSACTSIEKADEKGSTSQGKGPETGNAMQKSSNSTVLGLGPQKFSSSLNITTVTDFQPDVCKDFWQTGYCGYGDTCKFLHIRDELRQLKPIEKEWETVKDESKGSRNVNEKEQKQPYRCVICRKDYEKPVKTECDHIFCQKCFLNRCRRNKTSCFICKKDTAGICRPVLNEELKKIV